MARGYTCHLAVFVYPSDVVVHLADEQMERSPAALFGWVGGRGHPANYNSTYISPVRFSEGQGRAEQRELGRSLRVVSRPI